MGQAPEAVASIRCSGYNSRRGRGIKRRSVERNLREGADDDVRGSAQLGVKVEVLFGDAEGIDGARGRGRLTIDGCLGRLVGVACDRVACAHLCDVDGLSGFQYAIFLGLT